MSVSLAYITMILVWATTPLSIKMSTESVALVLAASLRVLLAALLGLVLAAFLRVKVPWHKTALRTYLLGNINIFLGVFMTFKGAQQLPSGMVSVLFGLSPVLSALLARFFLTEQALSMVQTLAVLLGLGGLVIIFWEQMHISTQHLAAVMFVLSAVLCFCVSNIALKRWPGHMPAFAQTVGSLVIGIPLYAIMAVTVGGVELGQATLQALQTHSVFEIIAQVSDRSFYAVLYLAVFGSLIGVLAYFYALTHLPANTVALATLITPMIALSLGRWLNNEILTRGEMFGAACIIGALALYYWGGTLTWRFAGRRNGVKPGLL